MSSAEAANGNHVPAAFATTSWTVVVEAGADPAQSRLALGELCRRYWYPLYAFLRRRGAKAEDAEDTVQAFFCWLTESGVVGRADPTRGRFRTFLITALKQFAARRHERAAAAKRDPGRPVVSIDAAVAADGRRRYQQEPSHDLTPDKQFEYAWAMSVIDQAMRRLRDEWEQAGKGDRFDALRESLTGPSDTSGRELAARLGMSEGAVRVAVHRLKRRYGEILREEVGCTVDGGEQVDEELNHLMTALRPG